MSTIKVGWLNDKNGDKFAPKTLTSQVTNNEGVSLDILLENASSDVDSVKTVNGESPDENGNVEISIPSVPTNISAFANDKGYLTSIPSEYITETELLNKDYATKKDVAQKVNYSDMLWMPSVGEAIGFDREIEFGSTEYITINQPNIPIIEADDGETFIVYIDDARYVTTVHKDVNGIDVTYAIGNLYLANTNYPDTGEPFAIAYDTLNLSILIRHAENETHRVRIAKPLGVNKLPEEFLPETAATKEYVQQYANSSLNRSTKVSDSDNNYDTYMARGASLNSTETVPSANGTIAWIYE